MTSQRNSGSISAWKARREAYRKTQGAVSNPGQLGLRSNARRFMRRAEARMLREVADYRQSIHCRCDQCVPGQDRECPAREPNVPNPNE